MRMRAQTSSIWGNKELLNVCDYGQKGEVSGIREMKGVGWGLCLSSMFLRWFSALGGMDCVTYPVPPVPSKCLADPGLHIIGYIQ